MLRRLCCLAPSPPSPTPAEPLADVSSRQKRKQVAPTGDSYEGPAATAPVASIHRADSAQEAAAPALQALASIVTLGNPGNAALSAYERTCLTQEGLDACVPWFAACRTDPKAIELLQTHFAAAALGSEAAGMLAGVCIAACIASMQRPARVGGGRARAANAAVFDAVFSSLPHVPGMAPFRSLLEACCQSARSGLEAGREVLHDTIFETQMTQLSASPPPSLEEIAFLQQALVVMSSVNVAAAYRVRHPQATAPMPPPEPALPDVESTLPRPEDARRCVEAVHNLLAQFVQCCGGLGLAARLRWVVNLALEQALEEPIVLQTVFEPKRWDFASVRHPGDRTPQSWTDVHSHLVGAMYMSVLFFMNGWGGHGRLGRGGKAPIAVESHRDFLAHAFTALHRGIMQMPEGWIPLQQLTELHRVVVDGVAKDCDPYTLRARMQAYAAAAATSPALTQLGPEEAAKIAEAWETVKSRLYTDEFSLTEPT